jgi:hypothetical protein
VRDFNVVDSAGGTRKALAKPFIIENAETIELELTPSGPDGPPPIISRIAVTAR